MQVAGLSQSKKAFDPEEFRKEFMGNLERICSFLITQGHNNEFRNPYKYALKDLFRVYDRSVQIYNQNLANQGILAQAAQIGTASEGGAKYFREYITKLTGH